MEVNMIECTVRLNLEGNTNLMTVPKAGPLALYAFEIPILRAMNDLEEGDEACCIMDAKVVDTVDMSATDIDVALSNKYKRDVMQAVYPGKRGYARYLADCELPDTSIARVKKEAA